MIIVGYCSNCHMLRPYDTTKQRIHHNMDWRKTIIVGPECDRLRGYRMEPEPIRFLGDERDRDYPRWTMREEPEYCSASLHTVTYEVWLDAVKAAFLIGGIDAANDLWVALGSPAPRIGPNVHHGTQDHSAQ
jgi:hypothetical protein